MSSTAIRWALDAGMSGPAQAVLLVLAIHHNAKTGQCNPSLKTISRESGFGVSTVKRALNDLEAAGLAHVEEQFQDSVRAPSQCWLKVGAEAGGQPRAGSPRQPTHYAPRQPRAGSGGSAQSGLQNKGTLSKNEEGSASEPISVPNVVPLSRRAS